MTSARKVLASAVLACIVAGAFVFAGCGGSNKKSSDTGGTSTAPVTLTLGLFGTFGYKEAGMYDEYMSLHPNVTIKETSIEQEQQYYPALLTHLAAGSGLADIQALEVGRIAEIVQSQADNFVNLNDLGAGALKDTYYPWKWQAATTKDGRTIGMGTDIGPLAICYRPDLFTKAGLPANRDEVAALWPTWEKFIEVGKQYQANAPKGSSFHDSASGMYNAIIGQSPTQYYDADGNPIYDTNPKVKAAWDLAMSAIANKETARLKQFDQAWNTGFGSGAFATIACPAWMIGYIKGQAGDKGSGKWDVAKIPGNGGNWGGSYLAIPKASKNQKAAYDLVKWLSEPEQQVKMWTKGQHFPSSSTAAANPSVEAATDPYFTDAPLGKIFGESAADLPVATLGPKDGVIKDTFSSGIGRVEQQGANPDKAWSKTLADIKNAIS